MKTISSWGRIAIALCVVWNCSCAPHPSFDAPAPRSSSEAGLLVKAEQEHIAELARSGKRIRRLHAGEKLYEVFGIVPSLIPEGIELIEANAFFDNLVPDDRAPIRDSANLHLKELLAGCKRDYFGPTVKINALNREMQNAQKVISLGQRIRFTSEESQAHPSATAKDLQATWFLRAPMTSILPFQVVTRKTFSMRPDTVGRHDLTLIVRDSLGRCESQSLSFAVTADPAFRPDIQQQRRLTVDQLRGFAHLHEIGGIEAWRQSRGKSTLVAIIDTGVNYNHPDLSPNIHINPREKANGRDDDGNGLVDDLFGWDFTNADNRPFDDSGHGTHVAGLVGATTFGVAPEARVLPVKVLTAMGSGDVGSIAAGIMYAADQGADIINASLGSTDSSFRILEYAIAYARSKGALFVAAAGNGQDGAGINIDVTPIYPASLPELAMITVAASHKEQLASYSNFGKASVDIAAPGGETGRMIRSLAALNTNRLWYVERSGTSMAAPLVSGAAALIRAMHPTWSPEQLRDTILGAGEAQPRLRGLVRTSRSLNVLLALEHAKRLAESPVANKTGQEKGSTPRSSPSPPRR